MREMILLVAVSGLLAGGCDRPQSRHDGPVSAAAVRGTNEASASGPAAIGTYATNSATTYAHSLKTSTDKAKAAAAAANKTIATHNQAANEPVTP